MSFMRRLCACIGIASAARVALETTTCSAKEVLYAEGAPSSFKNHLVDLSSHSLIPLLNVGVDASALQTCFNLHRKQGDWSLSWKKKLVDSMVSLGKGMLGSKARNLALQPLVTNILDWKQPGAARLMTWAFEHEDGTNPFCANNLEKYPTREERQVARKDMWELFAHFSHLLVSGHGEDERSDPASDLVNRTLGALITKGISASFLADCGLRGMTSLVRKKQLTWDTSIDWPPVVQRSFELLRETNSTARELYFIQQLVDLFQEYVKMNQVDLRTPELSPEIRKLWQMMEGPQRVYEQAEQSLGVEGVEVPRPASCKCSHIAQSVSQALGKSLAKLGFEADAAEADWIWQVTDISKMLDLFTLTEKGMQDPNLSFLHLLQEANHLPRLPTSVGQGVSPETAQKGVIKAILVGLPMLQNYLAHLDVKNGGDASIKENFAKKCKWFLFLNIAWAVWHENEQVGAGTLQRVSLQHRQQNVAMGLLVSAFAAVSEFTWDGKLFKETNSDAFNDFNVALYTVWNYRWVEALFEPRRMQFHFWHALGLPVLEALGNGKSSAYWVNYRRDGLMSAMINSSPLPQDDEA